MTTPSSTSTPPAPSYPSLGGTPMPADPLGGLPVPDALGFPLVVGDADGDGDDDLGWLVEGAIHTSTGLVVGVDVASLAAVDLDDDGATEWVGGHLLHGGFQEFCDPLPPVRHDLVSAWAGDGTPIRTWSAMAGDLYCATDVEVSVRPLDGGRILVAWPEARVIDLDTPADLETTSLELEVEVGSAVGGDLDGDGVQEVLGYDDGALVAFALGGGEAPVASWEMAPPMLLEAGDVDGDGADEVLWWGWVSDDEVAWTLRVHDADLALLASLDRTWGFGLVPDVSGDGGEEVQALRFDEAGSTLGVFAGGLAGTLDLDLAPARFVGRPGAQVVSATAADLDGDGVRELLVAAGPEDGHRWYAWRW